MSPHPAGRSLLRHTNAGRQITTVGLILAAALAVWLFQAHRTEPIDSYAQCTADGNPTSDTNPPTCTTRGHTFLGPVASPPKLPPAADAGTALAFQTLVDGDSRGRYPQRQEAIISSNGWEAYWRNVHAGLSPQPPLLPVDFVQHDVIALSEGPQATAGYGLKITAVTATARGTIVDVTESVPTITCAVAAVMTNRYFIAQTPKLPPPVSFRLTTVHRKC